LLRDCGIQHEFQKPVKINSHFRYIDFYFPQLRLAIEIDGAYHDTEEQQQADIQREQEIKQKFPIEFIRCSNDVVMANPLMILDILFEKMKQNKTRKGIIAG